MGELTPTERAGRAVYLLHEARARGMTANEIASRLGMTPNGARRLMNRLSRSVPVATIDQRWAICGSDGAGHGGSAD